MTKEQVVAVLEEYKKKLAELEAQPLQAPFEELVGGATDKVLNHCVTMIGQIEEFIAQGKMDKVFRWLGFLQGVLWTNGIYSINDLRSHNQAPADPATSTPAASAPESPTSPPAA